jgi:hypothetical protein
MSVAYRLTAALSVLVLTAGCSIKKMAVNKVGDMLSSSGSTFESDEDPELVAAAIPFGLKLYEGLLAETPKHTGLLLAAASGFTEYAYAFVDLKAEEVKEDSLDRANALTRTCPQALPAGARVRHARHGSQVPRLRRRPR